MSRRRGFPLADSNSTTSAVSECSVSRFSSRIITTEILHMLRRPESPRSGRGEEYDSHKNKDDGEEHALLGAGFDHPSSPSSSRLLFHVIRPKSWPSSFENTEERIVHKVLAMRQNIHMWRRLSSSLYLHI